MTIKYEPQERLHKVEIENFDTKKCIYFNITEDDLFLHPCWLDLFISVFWEQLGRTKYDVCEEILYNSNL